ncbi:MAG: histone deacetylase [Ktedonobacterales bacterium]
MAERPSHTTGDSPDSLQPATGTAATAKANASSKTGKSARTSARKPPKTANDQAQASAQSGGSPQGAQTAFASAPPTSGAASAAHPANDTQETPRLPTALITDPAFLNHLVPDEFPEQPERLRLAMEVIDQLLAAGTIPPEHVLRLSPRAATRDELTTVHTAAYVEKVRRAVEALPAPMPGEHERAKKFANEVYISSGSYTAATLAAGAPLIGLDAIAEGRARNAYALTRPPGHHARPDQAMGFCLFNNIAVAARYAQRRHGWRKVLIVDYDVHHGNGTQEIFYEDADVVYFSTHQFPWYPGTGASAERGEGAGEGATINVPLPAGSGWSVYDPVFRQVLWPVADRFRPDVILLSAGFDAHWLDPLAEMRLSNPDFSDFTLEVIEMADRYCDGRIVVVQEGGYHLDALAQCAATVLVALTGERGIVDTLGQPPQLDFRWNEEAIIQAIYQLHGLAGYRRKPRRPVVNGQALDIP